MNGDALSLDGNAIAGLLHEVFGAEMTAAPRGCQSCGAINPVGAHRVFRGAGTVMRCPACGDLALSIVVHEDRVVVRMAGTWTLALPVTSPPLRSSPH
jgi:hypothetical protein